MSFLQLRSLFRDPVIISTQSASGITGSGATGNGTLTSSRASAVTEMGFVYSTSANPTTSDTKVTATFTYGAYSASLSGLSGATTYHVRAYVTIAGVTYYGEDVSFATSGAGATVFSSNLLLMGVG